jgi:DNA-binding transcriptional LysR family regulator
MRHRGPPTLSPSLLAWLRCFDAAARCGSFTRAAALLHVSQGAVSQQVKKLEEWVGRPLLLRTAEGLVLTPEGERLQPVTRQALGSLEVAVHQLRAGGAEAPLNLSCSPSFAMLWLTLRLGDFHRTHPELALRVVGEFGRIDRERMARDGIAGAVRFEPPQAGAEGVPLFDEWLVPVATPAFVAAHPEVQDAHALEPRHLLHAADPSEEGQPTDEWARWLAHAGTAMPAAQLRQGTQFNLSQLAVQAALGGQGIAMGLVALVLGYLLQGRLVAPLRLRVPAGSAYRFLVSPSHPQAAVVRAWLLEQAGRFGQQRAALFEQAALQAA